MLPHQLPPYKNHQVASLAWAIGSAPLLHNSIAGITLIEENTFDEWFEQHRAWFLELDRDPSILLSWLDSAGQKLLGRRFESLLAFFFSHSPFFELLFQNELLMQGKNTSGEIDLIMKEKATGQIFHIECACKYYVGIKNKPAWSEWLGPNGHDTLLLKIEKMRKQVRIFHTDPGKFFLQKNSLPRPLSLVFMKGFFFHHFSEIERAVAPKDAHPHCNAGWFVYSDELKNFNDAFSQWLVLPKTHWTCPFHFAASDYDCLNGTQMVSLVLREILRTGKAQMIIQVKKDNDLLIETSRGFVIRR